MPTRRQASRSLAGPAGDTAQRDRTGQSHREQPQQSVARPAGRRRGPKPDSDRLEELARQAETDRALYESVLRQIKETSLSKDVKANAVSVIEHSPLPQSPVSRRPTRTIVLGLLGGLAVGSAFVFGADALDRSIKTVDQAENTLGLPVFAAVPDTTDEGPVNRLKRRSKKAFGSSNYRVVVETPQSPAAEAFRNLRAALALLGPEVERKVSLFASALPKRRKELHQRQLFACFGAAGLPCASH